MKLDLDTLSEKELLKLRADVDKALSTIATRRKADARKAAEVAAGKFGFSLTELVGGKAAGKKSAPKYRNPADASQTWTGRGRQPAWIKGALAAGKPLSDFAI